MPKMDETGPRGQGSMTGRGVGFCGDRMGLCGCRHSWGVRFRRFFNSPKNQLQALEDEEKILIEELEAIKIKKEVLKDQK